MTEPFAILPLDKALLGAMIPVFIHLNGERIGSVANGASIEFQTSVRMNAIVATDYNGAAVPGAAHTFEATAGGRASFRFKRGTFAPA